MILPLRVWSGFDSYQAWCLQRLSKTVVIFRMKVIEIIVRGDDIALVDAIDKEKGALDQWYLGPSGER